MTDVTLLVNLIEQEPESPFYAAMLVDELMEARGMLRTEADRHVERVQADARLALDLKNATALVAAKDEYWPILCEHLRIVCHLARDESFDLIVIPGPSEPNHRRHNRSRNGQWWDDITVTVGASWLMGWKSCVFPTPGRARTRRAVRKRGR